MIDKIVEEAKRGYKENLVAMYLTGSCANTDYIHRVSDIDLVIVLNEVTENDLLLVGKIGERLNLSDIYGLIPKSRDELSRNSGLWRLIDKYQSKHVWGDDFFKQLDEPKVLDLARDVGQMLRTVSRRRDKWKYSTFKSDEAFKDGMYWVLKRSLTLFNCAYYMEHGVYVGSRKKLKIEVNSLDKIIDAMDNWKLAARKDIVGTFGELDAVLDYVRGVSSKFS